jgi:thioredoxin 2
LTRNVNQAGFWDQLTVVKAHSWLRRPKSPVSEEPQHIVCTRCDTVNRIPKEKSAREAKCGRCHDRIFTGKAAPVSAHGFATQIERSDIPAVADFWADWCAPRKAMAPAYERVAAELEREMRFLKVDTEAEPELAARYNIRSIPTVMVFRNGAVVAQRPGAMGCWDAAVLAQTECGLIATRQMASFAGPIRPCSAYSLRCIGTTPFVFF